MVATPALLNTIPSGAGRPLRHLGGERQLRLTVTDVEPADQHRAADQLGGLLKALLVLVGDRHRAAVLGEPDRDRAADPGGGA